LIPLLKESEFCVFPSRLETFNIAALESMALGKAVIATKRGGPFDYIKNRWDGILVDPEDIDGLASAMDFLASNPTVRVEIGKHAQARAQDFKWDQVAKNYLSLYKACLAVAKTASSTTVCKNYSSFRIN
jgi:glycogen(starch) synthase